jgi:excisionase family DNA binding protein
MRYVYEAIFTSEEGGGYSVDFPDLQGCFTCGDDFADAVEMAVDVLTFMLAGAEIDEAPIPLARFKHHLSTNQERVIIGVDTNNYPIEVSTAHAAEIRGVTDGRIRQLIASGELEARKNGRDYLVSYASLKNNIKNKRPAGRPKKLIAA